MRAGSLGSTLSSANLHHLPHAEGGCSQAQKEEETMSQIISSYDEGLARMHDMVWDEHNGWLAIKKNHTSGSTTCENDWGWVPVFRSKTKLDEVLGGRMDYSIPDPAPNISMVPQYVMEQHPTIYQLRVDKVNLEYRVQELEAQMAALLKLSPLQESLEPQAGRKLQL